MYIGGGSLYEQYIAKDVTDSKAYTELLNSYKEFKTKVIQQMPNEENKNQINLLCDMLTDVSYEDSKRAFVEGFSIAEKLYISEFLRHGNIRATDRYMHLTFESKVNSANLITNELAKAANQ